MDFLKRWVNRVFRLTDADVWSAILGESTYTGRTVTEKSSLQQTVVWACARILSETFGSLPIDLIEHDGSSRRKIYYENNLYRLLHDEPNGYMTSVEFREAMMLNLVLWGNAYALIVRNSGGGVIALIPLLAAEMNVTFLEGGSMIENKPLTYQYNTSQGVLIYGPEDILHIKLFGFNGLTGLSPIGYCRHAIGLAQTIEEFGSRFFGKGARPSGFLMVPHILTDKQREKLEEKFSTLYEGLDKSHALAILEADMKYQQVSIKPEEAQFLETRGFQGPEICRIFLMPPHMAMDLSRATFSNIENQGLQFEKFTFRPYVTRWEQAFKRALLTPAEKPRYSFKFNLNALLRADSTARAQFYSLMVQNGIMSRNEARALEDLDPQTGGDELTVQSNMLDLDQLKQVSSNGQRITRRDQEQDE